MNRLRTWDQKVNQALERVGRGKRLAVNLTLCALIGVLIWLRLGCPLPTAEMEFRRLERTHLLPESEIVFRTEAPGQIMPMEDGPQLRFSTQFFVGLREDQVTLCAMEEWNDIWDREIVSLPRGEGPVLVPLLRECVYLEPVAWYPEQVSENIIDTRNFLAFLLLDAPAETARIEANVWGDGEEFSGCGWQMEDGNWLLGLESDLTGRGAVPYQDASYALRLYRADGTLLLERSGDFKEG